ncbi:MAG: energy-coupling factor transporter transmembrane protein EcfT [Acetobacteraceae bacterium]|nr:energy-coupling factor transporter transmembrane protein EcfT [Acetobacteraceae bacterium]
MIRNVPIGQFVPGRSIIHRLDPRTKILVVLVYVAILFVANNAYAYALLLAFGLAGLALTRLKPRPVLRGLRSVWFLVVLTVLLNLFMTPGPTLFRLGPLHATQTGAVMGLFMGGRLVLLILATSLLTLTTSPIDLTDGLERLLQPFRRVGVPAHELAMMMTIALRFIPTLVEEADKIMKAQMARGADFMSGNIVRRVRSLVPLLVPLFVSAFRRADDLALAMEARCYRGGLNRTRMRQLKFMPRDLGAALASVALVAGVVYLRLQGPS